MSSSKKYFQDFDYIIEAGGAKTLSYFMTQKNAAFGTDLFTEFKRALQCEEDRLRVSLHTNSEDKLHNMIIGMRKGARVLPHKHEKEETYHIVQGQMALLYFAEDGTIEKNLLMSPQNTLMARVDGGTYHAVVALEDAIYHEARLGPFISETDSKFITFSQDKMAAFYAV